jgi:hypothetical protein
MFLVAFNHADGVLRARCAVLVDMVRMLIIRQASLMCGMVVYATVEVVVVDAAVVARVIVARVEIAMTRMVEECNFFGQ